MSSYILFSQTSTAGFNRSTWGPGLGGTGGVQAPGNPDLGSAFSADLLTPAQLLAGSARFFDISSGANAALAAFGSGGGGTPLFAPAVNTTLASNAVGGGAIDLSQSDANWNGIKNIEIRLDSESDVSTVRIENIVDTRLKIGDDVCALTADGEGPVPFDVDLIGVKRGEVDATLAAAALDLRIDVWSNNAVGQNSFDLKGTVYDDVVVIGAGTVVGSMFGNKFGQTGFDGDGTYDGTFTKTFTNLGAGDDIFDSTNLVGDTLTGKVFRTVDKTWGGTGDDSISTGFGNDKLFGDNGSAANAYADPADLVEELDEDFIAEALAQPDPDPTASSPLVLAADGVALDRGLYTVTAHGGELTLLKTGGVGTEAGGLGIRSLSDGASLPESEIDLRGPDESIVFAFANGAHEVEIDLSAFFANEGINGTTPERIDYTVELADGSTFTVTETSTSSAVPAKHTIVIDESDTGGQLIKSIALSGNPLDAVGGAPISDFYVAAIRACVPVAGAPGDDVLDAGAGADFLEGNQDNGGFILASEVCLDFVLGAALSGTSEDTGFLLIESVGGNLAKLGDGATFGGLTVHSPGDQAIAGGTDFFTNEIDAFNDGVAEGVRFTFDGPGVTGFHIDLNLFFAVTFFEALPEIADFKVTLEDGSEVTGSLAATSATDPGVLQFAFGLGDSGGKLITGFEISASDDLAPGGKAFSEFTIAEFCYDGQLTIAAGDVLFLGDDADKDTVNFNDGDGVDTVFEFDTAKDCVRIDDNEALTRTVVVDSTHGVGTLIEHGPDGDGIFLVGVTDPNAITIVLF